MVLVTDKNIILCKDEGQQSVVIVDVTAVNIRMDNQSIKNFHHIQASKGLTISSAEEDKTTSKCEFIIFV